MNRRVTLTEVEVDLLTTALMLWHVELSAEKGGYLSAHLRYSGYFTQRQIDGLLRKLGRPMTRLADAGGEA
jgi:hypothetical protein